MMRLSFCIKQPAKWATGSLAAAAMILGAASVGAATQQKSPAAKPALANVTFSGKEAPGAHNCFWIGPVTPENFNRAFPDQAAAYWLTKFTIPKGGHLEITSKYPKARYFSYSSYDKQLRPYDALYDAQIRPDKGENPFARLNATPGGQYKINVVPTALPAGAAAKTDTLYLGAPKNSATTSLILRIYVPATKGDVTGGAGLPKVALVTKDGARLTGKAMCSAIGSPRLGGPGRSFATPVMPLKMYKALVYNPKNAVGFPAVRKVEWMASWNTKMQVIRLMPRAKFLAVLKMMREKNVPRPRTTEFYANPDNSYMGAYISQKFGKVLVLRGKMPLTPATRADVARAGNNMRYWSLCTNESLATTSYSACKYDSQVKINDDHNYTIVVSTAANRPSNAKQSCGVTWLNWGDKGDGVSDPDGGLLIIRNTLPSPDFHHAAQDVRFMNGGKKAMGAYLPSGKYTSKAAFESLGCNS